MRTLSPSESPLVMAVFAAVRSSNVQLLETLSDDEWQRTGTHSDDGPYSVETWLRI